MHTGEAQKNEAFLGNNFPFLGKRANACLFDPYRHLESYLGSCLILHSDCICLALPVLSYSIRHSRKGAAIWRQKKWSPLSNFLMVWPALVFFIFSTTSPPFILRATSVFIGQPYKGHCSGDHLCVREKMKLPLILIYAVDVITQRKFIPQLTASSIN